MAARAPGASGVVRALLLVALVAGTGSVAVGFDSSTRAAAQVDTSIPVLDPLAPAAPGDTVSVTGSGWVPEELCDLTWTGPVGDPAPSCAVSDSGELVGELPVPAAATPGTYPVTACQPQCDQVDGVGVVGSTDLLVQLAEPGLVVPTLQGLTLEAAQQEVAAIGLLLRPVGTGLVVDQAPAPGEPAAPGDVVSVSLDATSVPPTSSQGPTDSTPADAPFDRGTLLPLLAVLVLVVLILAGAVAVTQARRQRQKTPTVPTRPEAVPHPSRPPVVTVDGSDIPPRWTIGLVPSSDSVRTTLEERNP